MTAQAIRAGPGLDPALIEAFQRDGFVHVRALIPLAEIAGHRAAVDRAVETRTRGDGRPLEARTPFEQSFTMCQYLWEDHPDVGRLTFHPAVAGAAAALIGAERVRLWHDQALYKEAGGRETEMHQDHPYWPIAERDTLTAWIPLVEVDEASGQMGYLPGTHLGDETFINVFTEPGAGKAFEARQTAAPVFVACCPGDVVFHHGSVIHLARPNRTDQVRKVHTAIYFADGCTRKNDRAHYSLDRDGIAVGAPIDGLRDPDRVAAARRAACPSPRRSPTADDHPALGRAVKIGIFPKSA